MPKKETNKSNDLVQVVKVIGLVLLAIVVLFLIFAKEQIIHISSIVWGLVVLGIVIAALISRSQKRK